MESDERVKAQLMNALDLGRTLDRMARQIAEPIDSDVDASRSFALIGMQTRGVYLARRLQRRIQEVEQIDIPVGTLDVTMYRDDVRLRASPPAVQETNIPFDVTGRRLVLIDDVLFTGRTGRAALDALMDRGRPDSIRFLVIVDRRHRELPIAADIVGRTVPTLPDERVHVSLEEVDDRDGVWLIGNGE